jgi:hypothetical protein
MPASPFPHHPLNSARQRLWPQRETLLLPISYSTMIPSRIIPVHVLCSLTTGLPLLLRVLRRPPFPEGRPSSNHAHLWLLNRRHLSCRRLRHLRVSSAGYLQVPLEHPLLYLSVDGNCAPLIRVQHLQRALRFRLCIRFRKPTLFTRSKWVSFSSSQLLGWLIGFLGTKRDSRGASSSRTLGCQRRTR